MSYSTNGFVHFPGFLSPQENSALLNVVKRFQQAWLADNEAFYKERAINAAYLTSPKYLSETDRNSLFDFIGSEKLNHIAKTLINWQPAFMNTQLFFNPVNPEQPNYWHRDTQYHLTLDEQRNALCGPEIIHFRLALENEPGVEVIPFSHREWDSPEALNIRLKQNGRLPHEDIPGSVVTPLKAGDLFIFSANMLHRGLYGMNRCALDIIFCEPLPHLLEFVDPNCLPSPDVMAGLQCDATFQTTSKVLRNMPANDQNV